MTLRIEPRKLLQTYRTAALHLYHQAQPNFVRALAVVAVAVLGAFLLHISHAATPNTAPEAESGTLADGASVIDDANASGGQGVMFGSITPSNLQVVTGGNNIALVWDMPGIAVQSVQVWRNNTQVATVTPNSSSSIQNQQIGKEYDDNSVTAGSTYQYKVRAVLANGGISAFTPTISATQPTSSAPVPTIAVDTTGLTPAQASFVQNDIVSVLKTWYPKDADELAYPGYTVPGSFRLNFDSATGVGCGTSATSGVDTTTCGFALLTTQMGQPNNDLAAVYVHESTHILQDAASGPGWTIEGGASWASDFYARQNINSYVPRAGDQLASYTPGAWFIEFMRENYSANFPKDLNTAIHNGTYSDSIYSQDSGGKLTTQALAWQAAVNAYNTQPGAVTGVGGKCIEVQNGAIASGTKLVLNDCNASSQRLVTNAVFKPGVSSNLCLDDSSGGGTKSDVSNCISGAMPEQWTVTGNGEVLSEESHACLTSGSPATLSPCTGAASQLWTVGGNLIKNTASGQCLTDPGSSTTSGTATTVAACNGASNQSWKPGGQITTNADLAQQWSLAYRNTNKTGTFEITSATLGNPTGTDYCMDDSTSGTADGNAVQYWACNQTNAQLWRYDATAHTITNVAANKCLSTTNGASDNGTQIVIRTCDGGADQQWTVPAS